MPRGDNPNSRANLRPLEKGLPKKSQREIQRKGSEAGNKEKQRLKTFKELDDEFTTDAERKKMLAMLKKRAEQGNLKAFELYRDTMGMKPIEKVNVAHMDDSAFDEMREAMEKRKNAIHETGSNQDPS